MKAAMREGRALIKAANERISNQEKVIEVNDVLEALAIQRDQYPFDSREYNAIQKEWDIEFNKIKNLRC